MNKLAVIGSINIDLTIKTERIPSKGETVPGKELLYIPGGKGANQAVAMAKLGAEVTMFGCVGNDAAGRQMIENLKSYGICTEYIRVENQASTGTAVITVGEEDNTIVVVPGANACVTPAYFDSICTELLQMDLVLLQNEIPQETVARAIEWCADNGVRTIWNPAPARMVSQELFAQVSYLTPNEHEAALMFGKQDIDETLKKFPEKLIVTQGEKGVSVYLRDGIGKTIPPRKSKVVDTTGAGDTFNGAFAVQIALGKTVEEALAFANVAAGLSVERFGAQGGMPALDEVKNARKEMEDSQ